MIIAAAVAATHPTVHTPAIAHHRFVLKVAFVCAEPAPPVLLEVGTTIAVAFLAPSEVLLRHGQEGHRSHNDHPQELHAGGAEGKISGTPKQK